MASWVNDGFSMMIREKYSELNLNQYSVGSPCRNVCTVCGSPPCPDLNLIHYKGYLKTDFYFSGSLSHPIRYNPARIAAGQTVAAPLGGEESPGCTEQDAG